MFNELFTEEKNAVRNIRVRVSPGGNHITQKGEADSPASCTYLKIRSKDVLVMMQSPPVRVLKYE
jgi:hypothetical protein